MYYHDGERYEGDWRNGNREGKEFVIVVMEIDMKEILEMVIEKEKEYFILIMVIDMKETIRII